MLHPLLAIQSLKQIKPGSCVSWALEMVLLMHEIPNIAEGHFQKQDKGFGFESDYLAEMKKFGINTDILSFGEDWRAFGHKVADEINNGFHPIVTIPSYLHIDLDTKEMGCPCHAFVATSKNNEIVFITRSYSNPSKIYEISKDEFFKFIGSWMLAPASLVDRGSFLNLLAHS